MLIQWLKKMQRTHGTATLAALGAALGLLIAATSYLFVNLYEQTTLLANESQRHAASRGTQLELMMDRALLVPAIAVTLASQKESRRALDNDIRNTLRLSGIVNSLTIENEKLGKLVITRNAASETSTLRQPYAGLLLSPSGAPIVGFDGDRLTLRQPIVLSSQPEAREIWGYATAQIPISVLVHELRLPSLVRDGFAVGFFLHQDASSPPVVLYSDGRESTGGSSHNISLLHGVSLHLSVAPAVRRPLPASLLGSGIVACSLLLLFLTLRLLRRPVELQNEVTLRNQQLASEKAALQQEIEARIAAENHLEKSHALLDSVLDHLPGMVLLKRASDLRITRVNQSAEQVLGRSRDFLLGRSNEELYGPAFAQSMTLTDKQALNTQGLVELPLERLDMPGRAPKWILYRKLALQHSNDEHQYILEFGEDLTERELLNQKLRESLNFLMQLLEAIPGPMFYKDTLGRYLGVNSAFEQIVGKARSEIIGKTVRDVLPIDVSTPYDSDNTDRELMRKGGMQIFEAALKKPDGTKLELMFHKAIFKGTNGEIGGIVGVALDISERKAAEGRVIQLNRILTVLSETNELVVRIQDRDELLREVSDVLREKGNFALAWVHIEEADEVRIFAAEAGRDVALRMSKAILNPERPCAPSNRLACRDINCCDEKLALELAEYGHKALVHLPLVVGGAAIGGIGILGSEDQLFGEDEQRLLDELVSNICFALEAISHEKLRKTAEESLMLAAKVFENNAEGIIITDARNAILMVNNAFTTVTGYSAADVIGNNPGMLSSGRQSPDFYRHMWEVLQTRGQWNGEVVNRRKNGELYPEWLTITQVRNEAGVTTNYVAVFSDLTTRKEIEQRLNFLAHYDALTSLPNRLLFQDRLNQTLVSARRAKRSVGLLFLDLDRFKLLNETVGHSSGDHLLQEVSARLLATIEEGHSVSRLGGDQFAVIAQQLASTLDLSSYANKLQKALLKTIEIQGHEIHISASIGISIFPEDGEDVDTLTKNADSAMYQAIEDGGNTFRFFSHHMNESSLDRVRMEGKLHHALERQELEVHFQPFISTATGRIIGAEALLRWNRPDLGGAVDPTAFIPLLEETGLILPVGDWVLRRAAEEVKRWREQTGEDLFVAVNFSAVQLADPELLDKIRRLLDECGVEPSAIEVELTESAVMRDAAKGIDLMRQLRALGMQLSIDDFGTGYSSLSYLKQLPACTLKIDRSFVMDIPDDPDAVAIARAIVALGHSLGLQIVAEGVETPAQVDFLRDVGADIFQGFYFARPMNAESMMATLAKKPQFTLPAAGRYPLQLIISDAAGGSTSLDPASDELPVQIALAPHRSTH